MNGLSSSCRECGWPMHTGTYCSRCQERLQAEAIELRRRLFEAEVGAAVMRAALTAIESFASAPPIDYEIFTGCGLFCGVEDRCCADRYDGAVFGYAIGAESTREWAAGIAHEAIASEGRDLLAAVRKCRDALLMVDGEYQVPHDAANVALAAIEPFLGKPR